MEVFGGGHGSDFLPLVPIPPRTPASAYWVRVVRRYLDIIYDYEELESLILQTASMQELFAQAQGEVAFVALLARLEPGLAYLNDFSANLVAIVGATRQMIALVWGSIRFLLLIALPLEGVLHDVTTMLEEVLLTLPRLRILIEQLQDHQNLARAVAEVYGEVIFILASITKFIKIRRSHVAPIRKSWPTLSAEFSQAIKRLRRHSQQVELETEAIGTILKESQNNQMVTILQSLSVQNDDHNQRHSSCFHVPLPMNDRPFPREDIVQEVAGYLDQLPNEPRPRTLALHGMGGAGKTQIALRYAYNSKSKFDVILWISADTHSSMTTGYLEIFKHLGLIPKDSESMDGTEAMTKTKQWLADTTCSWLGIFDNADDLDVLQHGWPTGLGSILITTRDYGAASHPASHGIQVKSFDADTGAAAIIRMLGSRYNDQENLAKAKEISQVLGGLPLALNQMATYIQQQRMGLEEFLLLYTKHHTRIHKTKPAGFDYEHTIATIWKISLEKLSDNASTLLRLAAFLDPDQIDEILLLKGVKYMQSAVSVDEFTFLLDELDFSDTKAALFRAALVERSPATQSLSFHRLLQSAVLDELSSDEKTHYLSMTVKLLGGVFPSSWSDESDGYVYTAWDWCERCLPHVTFLSRHFANQKLEETYRRSFMELLHRCCWFLYESERYSDGESIAATCLKIVSMHQPLNTIDYATTVNMMGLLEVDLGSPSEALTHFLESLRIREALLPADDWGIAVSLSNVGLAYTEMGDGIKAMEFHNRALEMRKRIKCRLLDNSYANISVTLLRVGKPDEAESMYMNVTGAKDWRDKDFFREENPRYSSGLQLISMIREAQGKLEEALGMLMKVLNYRRARFGGRFKTCDSLCRIGNLLYLLGRPTAGLVFLEEAVANASSLPRGEGYLALAHFRIHKISSTLGQREASAEHFKLGVAARNVILERLPQHPSSNFAEDDEKAYIQLVAFLLW